MALRITTGDVDGIAVLWLDGRIVLGEETGVLRETVKNLITEGSKKVVLNMENVTLIDSAGIGALVFAYTTARSNGAKIRLCHLGAKFNELLAITKLLTVFDISPTQAEAVRCFKE